MKHIALTIIIVALLSGCAVLYRLQNPPPKDFPECGMQQTEYERGIVARGFPADEHFNLDEVKFKLKLYQCDYSAVDAEIKRLATKAQKKAQQNADQRSEEEQAAFNEFYKEKAKVCGDWPLKISIGMSEKKIANGCSGEAKLMKESAVGKVYVVNQVVLNSDRTISDDDQVWVTTSKGKVTGRIFRSN